MARNGFWRRVVGGLVAALRSNRGGNHHLSDGDWTLLEAPRIPKPRQGGERGQWTEDNLS